MNRRILRALIVSVALSAAATAQLAGTYTIDSSSPAGSGNYQSFTAAVADLTTQGVSASVTFLVFNGTGPYLGFGIPAAITGASATNTITFIAAPGSTPIVSGPASGNLQTIKLGTAATAASGPSFINLVGLNVQGAPSGAAILAAGCDSITISNCIALNCGTGIYFVFTVNSTVEDCEVSGCGMTPGAPGSATYVGGITCYSSANYNLIQRNRVHDCPANGIFQGAGGSNTAQVWNNVVINNFIWNCTGSGTYGGGIALRRITNSTIAHNSVIMPVGSTFNGLQIQASTLVVTPPVGPAAEISNNLIRHEGSGACVGFDVTSAVVPLVFDYNLYDAAGTGPVGKVASTNYATLAAWQAVTAPNLAGLELNSIAAPAGFLSGTDLHITPSSAAFNAGAVVTSLPSGVLVDIDGQARPLGGVSDIGADETPVSGLFAGFTGTPTSGNAPLTVSFTDLSYSSSGPLTSWAWDFDNNGVVDSTVQNPSYVYTCPGNYTVSLTVNDGFNPPSNQTIPNYIQVGGAAFGLQTTGGGVGDLLITPVPTSCGPAMGASSGWTLVSLSTGLPVGSGPAFGLIPDPSFWTFLLAPQIPGYLPHFTVTPGLYPDAGPVFLPPGSVNGLSGVSLDAIMVFIGGPASTLVHVSNVVRVTF